MKTNVASYSYDITTNTLTVSADNEELPESVLKFIG